MNAPDARTQSAAHRVAQLAAGDVLTQDDRDAIVRLVGELDDRWSEPAAPAADLPATLSSVDDVRQVCEAAEMESGLNAWIGHRVAVDVATAPDGRLVLIDIGAEGQRPRQVARLWHGAAAALLWHAIQAARSAS